MAASDRSQYKQVLTGVLGALRTVSNAALAVAQDAQRFVGTDVGPNAVPATGTFNYAIARVNRPVKLIEARILPGGALTGAAGNFAVINVVWSNENGGTTVLAGCNTNGTTLNTSVFPSTTGNWSQGTSILIAQNSSQNQVIPSGSYIYVAHTNTGASGVAVPGGTSFQLIWEEV